MLQHRISGYKLERIGPPKDAGYVQVNLFPHPVLFSGGAGENIDFEMHFAKMGSSVIIYDPTVSVLPKLHSNISHMPFALESKNSSNFRESCSLKDLNLRKHDEGLYLKLDIEGSEWELLLGLGEGILAFDQMLIQFHDLFKFSDPNFRSTAIKVIDLLVLNFKVLNFLLK